MHALLVLQICVHKSSVLPIAYNYKGLRSDPPCFWRQRLDPHHSRLDEAPERHHPNNDTDDVSNIVSILSDIAEATTVAAAVFVSFERARERLRNEVAFEELGFRWR